MHADRHSPASWLCPGPMPSLPGLTHPFNSRALVPSPSARLSAPCHRGPGDPAHLLHLVPPAMGAGWMGWGAQIVGPGVMAPAVAAKKSCHRGGCQESRVWLLCHLSPAGRDQPHTPQPRLPSHTWARQDGGTHNKPNKILAGLDPACGLYVARSHPNSYTCLIGSSQSASKRKSAEADPFYRWENRGIKRQSDLPKVIQQDAGRNRKKTQVP